MRLHSNYKIAAGHVLVTQPGDVLLCRMAELVYEPGDGDDDTDLHVNPTDFAAAKAMCFEPKGRVQ
ncbi:hypothetical protein [Bradyrhizobium sp. SBR1B]|uniref:hypothetical protein n=1 Tax=Bradyrhizobium sp. SBR1B TaxID=2663836 RepID=UPI0016059D52|nr:hypothetical protein [Bradyrhizobium sp. SBR1B]MBB4377237.1 hypothetical protein [Bradyrhizobium sp. SBR1B]